ncbi:cleavage and polyadenylation specificity factor subunit 6/7 [Tanacetum coccineum]
MDETNGRDGESFHRNEAISAVADEAFLGEEDDDDYEDLYNDVNVGDGFLQAVKKNESLPDPEPEKVAKGAESVPESVSDRTRKFENDGNGDNEGLGRVVASEGVGLGSGLDNVANKGDLGQFSVKVSEGENRSMSNMNNMSNMNSNDNGMGNVGPGPQQNYHNAGNMGNVGGGGGGGGTILFVGDLHWWTTDAELESELCKYGHVKEVKFFDEKASGKSKGYCQVEFYDPAAATACKEGMNGHVFNGRPCVVAFASPFSVKRMGEAQVNRTQQIAQSGQVKRGPGGPGEGPVKPGMPGGGNNMNMAPGGNFQGNGDNNRGYGRGNWGRNNGGGMAVRGRMGGRGRPMMGNNGNGYGPPPMMHPQSMMGQGFDPSFNGPMNRMGNYGFPGGPTPPFSGMMPSFPPVGNVGLPGLAPHVNPAFFGRGMPMNGMGMMQSGGPDGPNMGMWSDPNMSGWAGDEHGGRVGESSYGEEAGSDQQYGEGKEKERDWSGTSDRRVRDDREQGYERDIPREKETVHEEEWPEKRHRERDRDRERERERSRDRDRDRERSRDHHRHREEKDRYADHHRYRDTEPEYDEEWDRSRSSRTHGKSRTSHKDEHRSRSKEADYGKRRRVTAE